MLPFVKQVSGACGSVLVCETEYKDFETHIKQSLCSALITAHYFFSVKVSNKIIR